MDTAASTATPAAGWFADPHKPESLRWWDGARWTQHVHPGAAAQPAPAAHSSYAPAAQSVHPAATQSYAAAAQSSYAAAAQPSYAAAAQGGAYAVTPMQAAALAAASPESLIDSNPKSLLAIAFSLGYLAIALTTGVVILGAVPALLSFRAMKRGEKLAPMAILAAVITVGFAVTHMHHMQQPQQ